VKLGIVGVGTIGRAVCRAVDAGEVPGAVLAGLHSRDRAKAAAFAATLKSPPPVLDLDGCIAAADLLIEAATAAALEDLAPRALAAGKSLVVLSAGGLLEYAEWAEAARRTGARIYVPSGAILGLDGLKGARVGRIEAVTLVTRKPPRGLAGAPYVVERGIALEALTEETVLFEGTAREACKAFPANVNVSAALSLAGVGPDRTRVRVVAVPGLARNTHDIEVTGEFGRLTAHIENVPSEENPRTGKLSALSTIALLKDLTSPLRVGT
jgi:aspartate dehydrogenase